MTSLHLMVFRSPDPSAGGQPTRRVPDSGSRDADADAGADAGDGSIDATDDTTVTGKPDVSPAARSRDRAGGLGATGTGDLEGPHTEGRDTGYQKGGASGALGPADLDPDGIERRNPLGPDADGDAKGYRPRFRGDSPTHTGRAEPPPGTGGAANAAGVTNVRGPADDERDRESP